MQVIFFSHAEFEVFLENKAEEIFQKVENAWKNQNITSSFKFLILYSNIDFKIQSDQKNLPLPQERIEKILQSYQKRIKTNNGITRKDILELCVPLGLQEDDLDQTKLTTVQSFAESRGKRIHQSHYAITEILDKNDIIQQINQVLEFFEELNEKLESLENKQPPF